MEVKNLGLLNVKNIDRVIDLLKSEVYKFDMSRWSTPEYDDNNNYCGTAACVGGHISSLIIKDIFDNIDIEELTWKANGVPANTIEYDNEEEIPTSICEFFGIDYDTYNKMCFPSEWSDNPGRYTRKSAIKMLKHLKDTGEVVWNA